MSNMTDVKAELLKRLSDYYYNVLKFPHTDKEYAIITIDDVQFKFLSIDYDNLDNIQTTPTQIRRHRIDNPENVEITSRFTESIEKANEFTWSITEGLKLGAEASFSVTAPLIGKTEAKASAELSLESTQGQTVSTNEKWEQEVEVKVPPKTSIEATSLLEQATINTTFTVTLIATGSPWIERHYKSQSNPDFFSVGRLSGPLEIGWAGAPGPPPHPWLPDANSRKFRAKGVFNGVNGLYMTVTTRPLGKL
jgi:hypothetical protein